LRFRHSPDNGWGMPEPFEINDYLGHLIVFKLIGAVILLCLVWRIYSAYLDRQEREWRKPEGR